MLRLRVIRHVLIFHTGQSNRPLFSLLLAAIFSDSSTHHISQGQTFSVEDHAQVHTKLSFISISPVHLKPFCSLCDFFQSEQRIC